MGRRLFSMRRSEQTYQLFERWGFDEKGWSPVTRRKYAKRLRAADAWLTINRKVSIMMAGPKDLRAYLFSTTPNARNRNNIRQALVAGGEFAIEQGFQQVNSALALPRLREPQSLPRALDVDQGRSIAIAATGFGPMVETLVLVFLYAGLRKTEARLLEWRHIEADNNWLRFEGKGQKMRAVPIHENLKTAIVRWRSECLDPQWVFPSPRQNGHPISETHIKTLLYEVGEAAGVAHLHPHLLRHTFATRLVEKDAHLRAIQEALGHADPKTTSVYAHVRDLKLREEVAKLDF